MQYARMGRSGLIASRLSLGTMTFGEDDGRMRRIDQAGADRVVAHAIDVGINLFDTADIYSLGLSEHMLGRALGSRRSSVLIATKVGGRTGEGIDETGLSRRHIMRSIDQSLSRLGTDHVDLYIAHRHDPYTELEETLAAFDDLVRVGKVRHVGFSNWPAWYAQKAIGIQLRDKLAPFVNGQYYYSLVGRDIEHELVPFAEDAGIGLTAWSPLAMGYLAHPPAGELTTRAMGADFLRFDIAKGEGVRKALGDIAADHGVKPATVASAWLLTRPGITSITLGFSKPHHFEDSLAALDLKLSPAHLALLDAISAPELPYPRWFQQSANDQQLHKALGERLP